MNKYFMNVHKYKEDYSNISLVNFSEMQVEEDTNGNKYMETPMIVEKEGNYFVVFLKFDGEEFIRYDKLIDVDHNLKLEKLSKILNHNIDESTVTKVLNNLGNALFNNIKIPSSKFKLEVLNNSLESIERLENNVKEIEKELQDLRLEVNSRKLAYKSIQKEFLYPLHYDS